MRATSTRCGQPGYVLSGLTSAWVLIFNVGQMDEGVYTLQGQQSPASTYVLTFEYTEDADCFAALLQAEGFDLATPLCWDVNQLSAFCEAGKFEVSLVPQGGLLTPPTKNEYDSAAFERMRNGGGSTTEDGLDPPMGIDAYSSQRAAFERLYGSPDNDNDFGI